MCTLHDYCIERSHHLISASGERLLYPPGVVDDDDIGCGTPLQSHSNPSYGARIKAFLARPRHPSLRVPLSMPTPRDCDPFAHAL
eukprot:CAMPEP_0172205846 /NCGR_PEP_ID=MMETSP1050-20130122/32861_1 /TAXON_ID=233186 /ORGANISM="Cryptomonas curvata, Strain CCAP979/52" /LENGTH=84 /DNA_ID=CAMNT_0012884807 /DNA_START=385 /DNA_END=639 /DNA_ORIENTATION=-